VTPETARTRLDRRRRAHLRGGRTSWTPFTSCARARPAGRPKSVAHASRIPHLERMHEEASVRQADLPQLEQIAAGRPSSCTPCLETARTSRSREPTKGQTDRRSDTSSRAGATPKTWRVGPKLAASPRERGPAAPSLKILTGVLGAAPRPCSPPRCCSRCRSASAGTLLHTTWLPSSLLTWARRISNERI
jgi:hypothetical protein